MPDVKDIGLVDWFAGQAIIGILAHVSTSEHASRTPLSSVSGSARADNVMAEHAYKIAEALMRERGKRQPSGTG
jgi:hypothetical protein